VHRSRAKSRQASEKRREARKPPQRQGACAHTHTHKKKRAARRGEDTDTGIDSIPYPAGEDREHRVVWCRRLPTWLPRALPPCSRRQPAPRGPGGRGGSEPHRRRRRRVWDGKEEGAGSGGPSGFYPRRAPLLFITMAWQGKAGHHSTASSPRVTCLSRSAPTVLGSWPCLPASACLSAARGVSSLFARILTAPSLLAVFFLVPRRTPKRSPFTLLLLLASEDALPTNNQLRRCVICKTVYALFCSGRSKRRTSKELRRLCFIPMSLWYYLRLAAVVSWKNYAKFLA
jgi:hypothetical protein